MKIAFIVSEFPSITQTFVLNQITGLLDRGHDVTIFARTANHPAVVHADVERYRLLERTCYYGDAVQAWPANKVLFLLKMMRVVIANVHKKPLSLFKSLYVDKYDRKAASLHSLRQLAAFLGRDVHTFDIVHCHFGPNGNFGAWLKALGVIEGKLVTTFHGYDISEYMEREGNHIYDALFGAGDWFLPISERWRAKIVGLGCKERRVSVHRMGVDTSKFSFAPHKPRGDGKIRLLSVARFVEKKGVQYGIQAVARVLNKYPHVEYLIVGDGPLRDELKGLVDNLNLNNHVKLLGWKRQEEIVELMRGGDILLAPSVTTASGDQEGIPVVLMEALSQGLPVLSTHHSGIPELIQDGEFGFLVPERDVDALVERLEYLIEHPELWPKMGRAGRDHVARYYDINRLNDQLVDLYRGLLNGRLP